MHTAYAQTHCVHTSIQPKRISRSHNLVVACGKKKTFFSEFFLTFIQSFIRLLIEMQFVRFLACVKKARSMLKMRTEETHTKIELQSQWDHNNALYTFIRTLTHFVYTVNSITFQENPHHHFRHTHARTHTMSQKIYMLQLITCNISHILCSSIVVVAGTQSLTCIPMRPNSNRRGRVWARYIFGIGFGKFQNEFHSKQHIFLHPHTHTHTLSIHTKCHHT